MGLPLAVTCCPFCRLPAAADVHLRTENMNCAPIWAAAGHPFRRGSRGQLCRRHRRQRRRRRLSSRRLRRPQHRSGRRGHAAAARLVPWSLRGTATRMPSLLPCWMARTLWVLAHSALLLPAAAHQGTPAGQQPHPLLGPSRAPAQPAQPAALLPGTPRTALPHQLGRPSRRRPPSGQRGAQASRLPAAPQLPQPMLPAAVVPQGAMAAVAAFQAAAAASAALVAAAAAPVTAAPPAAAGPARGGCFRTSTARSSTAGKQLFCRKLATAVGQLAWNAVEQCLSATCWATAMPYRARERSYAPLCFTATPSRSFNSMLCPITLEPFEDPV